MGSPEERFSVLFESTHRALLAYALRRVADPADAADVVAETFLVAWRRMDDVPDGDQARPWLFGVARRVLANLYRGERRRHALADRLRENLTEVVPPPDVGSTDVERALRRLGEGDREILRLVAWEELAHDEIAVVLGVSRGAVRVRLHRARRRLLAQLDLLAADESGPEPAKATAAAPAPAAGVAKRIAWPGHVVDGWAPARPGTGEVR